MRYASKIAREDLKKAQIKYKAAKEIGMITEAGKDDLLQAAERYAYACSSDRNISDDFAMAFKILKKNKNTKMYREAERIILEEEVL